MPTKHSEEYFFSPALWENVNKLWNGFSILIGCLDRTIIWFSFFIGLFQRPAKFSILARKMRHNARQSDNNRDFCDIVMPIGINDAYCDTVMPIGFIKSI